MSKVLYVKRIAVFFGDLIELFCVRAVFSSDDYHRVDLFGKFLDLSLTVVRGGAYRIDDLHVRKRFRVLGHPLELFDVKCRLNNKDILLPII